MWFYDISIKVPCKIDFICQFSYKIDITIDTLQLVNYTKITPIVKWKPKSIVL